MRDHVELVKALWHCATVHDCTGCEYGCDANGLPRNRDLLNDAAKAIELPDHGDLIDRDSLFKQMGVTDMDCDKCEIGNHGFCGRGGEFRAACEAIENAPVIVPSNKEGSECF